MATRYPVDYSEVGRHKRPYLSVFLTGPNGVPVKINGIVDSGADYTSFPYETLRLLGYRGRKHLREKEISQVSGRLDALQSTIAAQAYVDGLPEVKIELYPVFIQGAESNRTFQAVRFIEQRERFELQFK